MMASVSTLARSIGATSPLCTVKACIVCSWLQAKRRTSTKWPFSAAAAAIAGLTRWVRPPAPWRPFEVAVAGGGATLAGLEAVGVHRQAHRAARLAPLEAGRLEDLVQAFLLGLRLHQAGARHHHRQLDARRHALADAAHDGRCLAQVLDAAVGARADEHLVDADVGHRLVRREAHVDQRALDRVALGRVLLALGIGHAVVDRQHHLGRRAPGDLRLDLRRRRARPPCRSARRGRCAACASAPRPAPTRRPRGASRRPLHVVDRRVVDRRPGRRARRPRWPCCTPSCALPSTARGSPRRRTRWCSRCRRRCRCGR